jgi:hypothetical protein
VARRGPARLALVQTVHCSAALLVCTSHRNFRLEATRTRALSSSATLGAFDEACEQASVARVAKVVGTKQPIGLSDRPSAGCNHRCSPREFKLDGPLGPRVQSACNVADLRGRRSARTERA